MSGLKIRNYQNSDWSAVLEMLVEMLEYHLDLEVLQWFKKDYSPKLLPNLLRGLTQRHRLKTGKLLVAVIDNQVVGFSFAKPFKVDAEMKKSSVKTGAIEELFVRAAFRRRGVAKMLIAAQEKYLRAEGCKLIRLKDVYAENKPAIKLYEQLGYIPRMLEFGKRVE